mmetsp:Transcript_37277/g.86950  ORF Transcript_37277/g.86950 Transcript_37277/m.86950 type:complete len:259 (-) Transcript_37277:422-1198(-)
MNLDRKDLVPTREEVETGCEEKRVVLNSEMEMKRTARTAIMPPSIPAPSNERVLEDFGGGMDAKKIASTSLEDEFPPRRFFPLLSTAPLVFFFVFVDEAVTFEAENFGGGTMFVVIGADVALSDDDESICLFLSTTFLPPPFFFLFVTVAEVVSVVVAVGDAVVLTDVSAASSSILLSATFSTKGDEGVTDGTDGTGDAGEALVLPSLLTFSFSFTVAVLNSSDPLPERDRATVVQSPSWSSSATSSVNAGPFEITSR